MNRSMIRYILFQIVKIEGILFFLPAFTSVFYHEREGFVYLGLGGVFILIGAFGTIKKPVSNVFYLKDGCVATALSWFLLSALGALPFVITREIPRYVDALFETISGFTTTGASILSDVEALSHASLMWRSFTHWVGGMGVLVFLLAVIPLSGGSNINLMRAESPGPSVDKLVPKIKLSARLLYYIYAALTAIEFFALILAKMPVFDALNSSFATAGTGGFGIKADSIASYSPTIQWIITIFMILFGVNFNFYYLVLFGKVKKAFAMEEVRTYLGIILTAIVLITINIYRSVGSLFTAITQSSFQVASIITTTGFSTTDFNLWPEMSKMILVFLMFIGACAGSTGGGIKVSRIMIMVKTLRKEISSYIHPKSIKKINMDGRPIEHEVVRSTNVYLITFLIVFIASIFLLSFENTDLITSFTAVAATINNIGPGLELVGPSANFGFFSDFSKIVLMIDMLAGRLELFPLLILFTPDVWKTLGTKRQKRI